MRMFLTMLAAVIVGVMVAQFISRKLYASGVMLGICLLVFLAWWSPDSAFAQASNQTSAQVTCPAAGSSIEALAGHSDRFAYALLNQAGKGIRVGYGIATGTPNLTTSNSILLNAGEKISDSVPGVYVGRIVCMSNDGTAAALDVTESRR